MHRNLAALLAIALLFTAAAAQESTRISPALASSLPAVQPPNRAVIGVALEGGGALGLAHIGILQWLEEHRIPVDRLSGTSMGALIGALYATGNTPAEMRALAVSDAFTRVFSLQTTYADSSFRRREDRRELPQAFTVGLKHGVAVRNALLADRGVSEFLTAYLPNYNREELDYDHLPIPFRCVATDLNTLAPVTFDSGPLPLAVRASISIPGIFPPVQGRNGHYLVDGGIVDNLPTDVLKHDLHADTIIAIRLEDAPLADADTISIVGVLNRAFSVGIVRNVEQAEKLADVVVLVPVGSFSGMDYAKATQLIDAGYKAAEQNRAALLRYSLDADGWKAYLAGRESRRRPPPGLLRQLRVEGGEPGAIRAVRSDLKPLEGRPITHETTLSALKGIQSNGGIAAAWETYTPTPTSPAAAQPAAVAPDTGLLVRLSNDRTGPPYLLINPAFAATTSNMSRGEMTLRLIDQNLGGFGSELRANASLGYMTAVSVEYYRQLNPNGFFIEPRIGIQRKPVYLWVNQKRVTERFQQNLDAGIEIGQTFSNKTQISAEWRAENTHWSLRTGTGGGPYLNGIGQTGLLHIKIDRDYAGAVSPNGFRLEASAGALYHAVASDNAPLINLFFRSNHSWKETNLFGVGGEINSYLRTNVAEPYRFALGGPMHLSASSFDEYRGTDTYLATIGYMRRLAALPTGLGHGLYGVFSYEAGQIWSPENKSILRQDGVTGLVASTPIGLITFGISVGDAGHRKVFVTVGRWF
jgi:NTE family protein